LLSPLPYTRELLAQHTVPVLGDAVLRVSMASLRLGHNTTGGLRLELNTTGGDGGSEPVPYEPSVLVLRAGGQRGGKGENVPARDPLDWIPLGGVKAARWEAPLPVKNRFQI